MYSLIYKVYFYAASGGESDPKRLKIARIGEDSDIAVVFIPLTAFF
jgi:hypothetical protein